MLSHQSLPEASTKNWHSTVLWSWILQQQSSPSNAKLTLLGNPLLRVPGRLLLGVPILGVAGPRVCEDGGRLVPSRASIATLRLHQECGCGVLDLQCSVVPVGQISSALLDKPPQTLTNFPTAEASKSSSFERPTSGVFSPVAAPGLRHHLAKGVLFFEG